MRALQNKQEEQQIENHINSQNLTPVSYDDKIHLFSYEELCIEHSQKRQESLTEYKRKWKEAVTRFISRKIKQMKIFFTVVLLTLIVEIRRK